MSYDWFAQKVAYQTQVTEAKINFKCPQTASVAGGSFLGSPNSLSIN